jgi:hypothetical protein
MLMLHQESADTHQKGADPRSPEVLWDQKRAGTRKGLAPESRKVVTQAQHREGLTLGLRANP